MRVSMPRPVVIVAAAAVVLAVVVALAHGVTTTCNVAASGGFANCLSQGNPNAEIARSLHAAGRPYRFQLHRPSDGAVWGPWQWNDGNHHVVFLSLPGTITAQVDNLGSGTTAYEVTLQ